jgi:CO/xanthine dehydrogenase Mo-binding subunit
MGARRAASAAVAWATSSAMTSAVVCTDVTMPTDCPANPLGIKGCGEAGSAGGPPALVNAVVDALAPYGVVHVDLPTTAESLWRVMRDASASGARPSPRSGL